MNKVSAKEELSNLLNEAFNKIDKDEKGSIPSNMLKELTAHLGEALTAEQIKSAAESIDKSGSGFINRDDFVAWWIHRDSGAIAAPSMSTSHKPPKTNKKLPGAQLSTMSSESEMLSLKNDRRRAESDVQLLANRLIHLRNEEDKAERKIEETRKRATEIQMLKKQRIEQQRKKDEEQERLAALQSKQRDELLRRKETLARSRKGYSDISNRNRTESVIKIRSEKDLKTRILDKAREDLLEDNKRKRELIRKKELDAKARKDEEQAQLKLKRIQDYRNKMEEEKKRKDDAERMIAKMEREEADLIEKLRLTQDRQRAAYEELEQALHLNPV